MKLLCIDGNSIMNRAFYGIKALSNSSGIATNAVLGFMNIYLKEISVVTPDLAAVAFDLPTPTFRHKANSAYKANRKGMPPELAQQMPIIKELLTYIGVKIVECEGYEADDILGTLSKAAQDSGNECVILTGDRDSFQLVSDSVTVHLAGTKETKVYDRKRIMEEYGIEPRQFIEVKALMGDSSDNISGVKGIGEKTALNLITKMGTVENLYENLDQAGVTASVRTKLENGKEDAQTSRFLGEICLTAPVETSMEEYVIKPVQTQQAAQLLSGLEMYKLMERLEINQTDISPRENFDGQEEKSDNKDYPVINFDEEKPEFNKPDERAYFLFRDDRLQIFYDEKIYVAKEEKNVLCFLKDPCEKVSECSKEAYKYAMEREGEINGIVFSCDLAGYLLKPQASGYSIKQLCEEYNVCYREDKKEYEDISSMSRLSQKLEKELVTTDTFELLKTVEMPLSKVLAYMEHYGVEADTVGIENFGKQLREEIEKLSQQIYQLAGEQFNISSPKQLGEILFNKLGLPAKKKNKSGYSTNVEVLEELSNRHPIVNLVLEYRTLTKLESTYVEGLLKEVGEDGRVHSQFKQTETRTGRISSANPNMQNIPVRKEAGRNMRKFFKAKQGYMLVDADYSQIELRVLASVCGDENMKQAFLSGKDIHTATAAQVFGVPEEFVLDEMRTAAKAVNFGIIYGISAFSLSKDIGVTVKEAKEYIENYFSNYPGVKKYMDKTVEQAEKDGFVSTIFGRKRYIPELRSQSKQLREFGKRAAMNAPIQGTAADIIKIAMIKVFDRLQREIPKAKLILQVHDELIVEVPKQDCEFAKQIVKEEMENACKMDVPLTVDVGVGENWYKAKG